MRKSIFLFGLMAVLTTNVNANEIVWMSVTDHVLTPQFDHIFEIKTAKPQFDQVVLDCQSFITGMDFIVGEEVKHNVYVDMFQCEELVNFLDQSKAEKTPVCLGLDTEYNEIIITKDSEEDCI